jgi:hypothetical protein
MGTVVPERKISREGVITVRFPPPKTVAALLRRSHVPRATVV